MENIQEHRRSFIQDRFVLVMSCSSDLVETLHQVDAQIFSVITGY